MGKHLPQKVFQRRVAEELHPIKNGSLRPEDITPGSHQVVWWLGKCGHEWEARVNSRVRSYGCPICRRIERERRSNQRKVLSDSYAPVGATLMDTSTSLFQWACQQRHLRGVSFDSIAEQLGISRDMAERLCYQDSSEDEVLENLSKRDAMVGDAYVA